LLLNQQYARALPLLTEICRQQPRNLKKRQLLAEVLVAVGEAHKAFRVLEELVNDFARIGQVASAIATVKRMRDIEPGRQDLAMKLAVLVTTQKQQASAAPPPDRAIAGPAIAPAPPPERAPPGPAITPAKPVQKAPPREPRGTTSLDGLIRQASIDEVLLGHPSDPAHGMQLLRGSELLKGFAADELEALIGQLQLTIVEAGEIIVAEGEPGDSLYLIASGSVRVYVRSRTGAQNQVRVLQQGDFFGEISLLKRSARTATITAATRTELLELDRGAVNSIAARHPNVLGIIEDFCLRREGSIEEASARSRE
jgi:hypothetical protein